MSKYPKSSYPEPQTTLGEHPKPEEPRGIDSAWDERPAAPQVHQHGPSPKPPAPIRQAIGQCHTARHDLADALRDLEERLGPVLTPQAPTGPTEARAEPENPDQAPVTQELAALKRGYNEAEQHIRELISRLEV
jgi:hypothetical protein